VIVCYYTDVDEELHILFEGQFVDLLIQVEPSFQEYVTHSQGKKILYASLNKVLYGTVQASLLFWWRLSMFLIDNLGFARNSYDWCVVNKVVNGAQNAQSCGMWMCCNTQSRSIHKNIDSQCFPARESNP
jgi:hypothetical protein